MVQAAEEESDCNTTNNNLTREEIGTRRTRQEINESNKTVHSFCCICCCLSVTIGILFIFWWLLVANSY